MTQDCSLPSSTAQSDAAPRRSLQGIHIIGTDEKSASKVEGVSSCEEQAPPWGYLFMQHMVVEKFQKLISNNRIVGDFHPPCFIHRTVSYKRKPSGKGVMKEEKPTVSGLVFLQGTTAELRTFLSQNFPQYHLVRNCATGLPASIPHSVMKPFMRLMSTEPERVTFLRDPFLKFAKDHVKLRVLTGPFKGQEGYIVRVNRDRQLVMDLGGYAVAISRVHREDFEVVEE